MTEFKFVCRNCGGNEYIESMVNDEQFICTTCTSVFTNPDKFTLPTVYFKFFPDDDGTVPESAKIPSKAHEGDSGFDLYISKTDTIKVGEAKLLSTNISCELPENYEFQVRPRSSTPKLRLLIPNSPGTIDNVYTGHMKVWCYNASDKDVIVNAGDRICQVVPMRADQLPSEEKVDDLKKTNRGANGFGSTGR